MPILKNAKKTLRASARKAAVNTSVRSKVKTTSDKVKKTKDKTHLPLAQSAIDKAVKKNLLPKNKAARLKSRLTKLVSAK